MRPSHTLPLITLLAALAPGCGDNQEPEAAEALWTRIHDLDYRSFARAPGYEARRASDASHGDEVDIYVNATIHDAIAAKAPLAAWPDGALIVKDGWSDGELAHVAVMEKRGASWFWAEYEGDGDGDAKYSGEPEICTDCHASGSDSVRAFSLP